MSKAKVSTSDVGSSTAPNLFFKLPKSEERPKTPLWDFFWHSANFVLSFSIIVVTTLISAGPKFLLRTIKGPLEFFDTLRLTDKTVRFVENVCWGKSFPSFKAYFGFCWFCGTDESLFNNRGKDLRFLAFNVLQFFHYRFAARFFDVSSLKMHFLSYIGHTLG